MIGAHVVQFKRQEKSAYYENGIALVRTVGVYDTIAIYDKTGEIVQEVWSYRFSPTFPICDGGITSLPGFE